MIKSNIEFVVQKSKEDNLRLPCIRQGIDYTEVEVMPFSDVPIYGIDSPLSIFYGSVQYIHALYEKYKPKGIFYNDNFSMRNYSLNWKEYMLNYFFGILNERSIISLKEVESHLSHSTHYSEWFIRPNLDDKSFDAQVLTAKQIIDWKNTLVKYENQNLNENTEVLICKPYNISKEWRNFIVNGKVISSSRYREYFKLSVSNKDIPEEMIKFSEDRCKEYAPHDVFVMDIGLCGDEYYIIECGCFNCAGFYACDIDKIIKEVSDYMTNN